MQGFGADAAPHGVIAGAAGDRVLAAAGEQKLVIAGAAAQQIVTLAVDDQFHGDQRVIDGLAIDHIARRSGAQIDGHVDGVKIVDGLVDPGPAIEQVIADAGGQMVVAVAAEQAVVALIGEQAIAARAAGQGVIAGAAP